MSADDIDHISGRTADLAMNNNNGLQDSPGPMNHGLDWPPQPQIFGAGVVATDITNIFSRAAATLEVGELVKDEHLTLFETVGAIEIMDPKMDTGFLKEGETMDDDYDLDRELSSEQCLGIIDELLCLEMAWHKGHPLSKTLFTSLYIDRVCNINPKNIEDIPELCGDEVSGSALVKKVLYAYCIAVLRTCLHVNERVKSEHFYEEEDFTTHTFNRSLLEAIPDAAITELFDALVLILASADEIETSVRNALVGRLTVRSAFLQTVSVAPNRTDPGLEQVWRGLLNLLKGAMIRHELAQPVPEAFSEKLQRKLASTMPPRPAVKLAFEEAYRFLERLCEDGRIITEVLDFHDSHTMLNFVSLFQKRKPQPCVYIRTLLQHYLFSDMVVLGKLSLRDLLDADTASLVLPSSKLLDRINDEIEVPHDSRHQMAAHMERFRQRTAQSYLDIYRTMCQNRCRIRRSLHHSIADWDNVQLDAEDLDVTLRKFTGEQGVQEGPPGSDPMYAFPLSSWAFFWKLRQMMWHVQMGFELDVYAPEELNLMYRFLSTLANTLYSHLGRTRSFVSRAYLAFKKDKSAENKAAKAQEFEHTLSFINLCMLECTSTADLATGLSQLYTVLVNQKLIKIRPHPYASDAIRYEQRMKSYRNVSLPELIPFEVMKNVVTPPDVPDLDLLAHAADNIMTARKGLEALAKLDGPTARCSGAFCDAAWHKDVKDRIRSCIGASIDITMVKKALEASQKEGGTEVKLAVHVQEAEKGYHDWWNVPIISPVK